MPTPNTTDRSTQERTQHTQPHNATAGTAQTSGTSPTEQGGNPGTEGRAAHAEGPQAQRAQGDRAQDVPVSREARREAGRNTERDSGRSGALARQRGASAGLAPYGAFGSPFALMHQLQSEMDRLFEDFGFGRSPLGLYSRSGSPARGMSTGRGTGSLAQAMWTPQLDMFRRGDELVVRADLPGLSKDDVTLEVEEGVLTIRGERRQEAQEDREGYFWSERSYGTFERSIALPEGVDEEQVKASFRDGVLEVTMPAPKAQEQRRRRIEIR
jgi:HSP20 family protein